MPRKKKTEKKLSTDERFMKGCAGKVQHKTYLSATYFLETSHSKSNADIYKCSECGWFHIGTSRNKGTNKILKMKYYLGIDPGKQGAFVVLDESSNIVEKIGTPLIGKEYDRQGIIEILSSREFHKVGLENPDIIFGIGKSAVASLSHCVGLIEGILLGLNIPHVMIKPKEWQKECWKHVKTQKKADGKTNDTKATSIMAAVNLWPREDFKVTNKGGKSINHNEGMVDAVLVAEYVRRMFK